MWSALVGVYRSVNCNRMFVFGATAPPPPWARASSFTRILDYTQRRTTVGRTPLEKWSGRRRDLYLKTLTTNVHVPGGIRTHDLSRRAAADLRLRPRDQWDRLWQDRPYTISDIMITRLSTHFRCPPIFPTATLWNIEYGVKCHIELAIGKKQAMVRI